MSSAHLRAVVRDVPGGSRTGQDVVVSWGLPIEPPVEPMLAKLARRIPDAEDGSLLFEPKWDGFRCIVFRHGDRIELQSRNKKQLGRYFPELLSPLLDALPERCVVDGEIVVPDLDDCGLDFDALQQRIHPAASRVERLARETPAEFVAFDVLALGDETLLDRPMEERRERLLAAVQPDGPVRITPASIERARAEEWFVRFEGAGLDGVIAKPIDGRYEPGKRSLVKIKHERTGVCAVPGFRVHKDGEGVGSLLLGLWETSADGSPTSLRSVGVAAAFSVATRRALRELLEPRTGDALADHPWAEWAAWQGERAADVAAGRTVPPTNHSRWNVGKDLSFVPIRMGLVAEVTFGQLEGGRFRHGVKFVRWRDDLTPYDCTYDQLDVAAPVRFATLFE
ncbi:MAG: ATP-dependent DNA ligase [Actinomycetota bacterium]